MKRKACLLNPADWTPWKAPGFADTCDLIPAIGAFLVRLGCQAIRPQNKEDPESNGFRRHWRSCAGLLPALAISACTGSRS